MLFSLSKVALFKNDKFIKNIILSSLNRSQSGSAFRKLNLITKSKKLTKMKDTSVQLESLRNLMKNLPSKGSIDAYIVPTDDAHQSEWISTRDERRAYICGFDGSAGTALITQNAALLWTDGRYYQQATMQMDKNWILMKDNLPATPEIAVWLNKNLPIGSKVGADPMLLSFNLWDKISKELESHGNFLQPIEENLIDIIWTEQPAPTNNKIINLPIKYTGRTIADKLKEIRSEMIENEVDALVVTALDEVAYLLNMRGNDIQYNPLFFAYCIVTKQELYVFVDTTKFVNVDAHFSENNVTVILLGYNEIKTVLLKLVNKFEKKFWISSGSSFGVTSIIPIKKRIQKITPISLMKAIKNDVEAKGMIESHKRDGLALCQYFAWVEDMIKRGKYVDEISGAEKLEWFRSQQENFVAVSFPTINGSGPNGSVIHYGATKETNRPITDKDIYLCDSGAHFLDGTTDVTRTMHFGTPNSHEIECYTRVLKGQINLGSSIFPKGMKGMFLDSLARKALWDAGLDYLHGTGHGIGHYLCVHEGPMGVGFRIMPDDPGLSENMFISNEPGYYEDGKFGMRIEDIVQTVSVNIGNNFNGRGALTFNTVTMCPIQTKMVDVSLLTEKERKHLNDYHQRVLNTHLPVLEKCGDKLTVDWLKRETQPI